MQSVSKLKQVGKMVLDADSLDQPSNVHNIQKGRDLALWMIGRTQPFETLIWHMY